MGPRGRAPRTAGLLDGVLMSAAARGHRPRLQLEDLRAAAHRELLAEVARKFGEIRFKAAGDSISVGDLTVSVTEITIFVKCHAQSTGVVPASPWSSLAEITSQSAGNGKRCHRLELLAIAALRLSPFNCGCFARIRIVADGRIGREHFMEPSVRRSPC